MSHVCARYCTHNTHVTHTHIYIYISLCNILCIAFWGALRPTPRDSVWKCSSTLPESISESCCNAASHWSVFARALMTELRQILDTEHVRVLPACVSAWQHECNKKITVHGFVLQQLHFQASNWPALPASSWCKAFSKRDAIVDLQR